MDKEKIVKLVEKFNNNTISIAELSLLENAIESGDANLEEFPELSTLYRNLDYQIPEPSENLRANFYKSLAGMKESGSRQNAIEGLRTWLENLGLKRPAIQVVYAMVLIIAGFGIGQWTQTSTPDEQINQLTEQVSEMRELMMLTLIKESSATDRLKAVNMAMDFQRVDEKMIVALLSTLNNDDNANVRLAAVNVLLRFADKPEVRQGLIEAIPNQDNAMLQYALAEAMMLMQEKNSLENLKELLKKDGIDVEVKNKLEETISKLS